MKFVCSFQMFNWQCFNICSADDGSVPNKHQAIILTNDRLVYWCIYVSCSLSESCDPGIFWNIIINTLRLRQNGRHFADDIFKCIFLNENVWFLNTISLKFVPKGLINNIPALVQIMAWRRPGDKPLSESMMVSLLTHICVTRPQLVKQNRLIWQPVLTGHHRIISI